MYLDPKTQLYGYPALVVRKLLSWFPGSGDCWRPPREVEGLTQEEAEELARLMLKDGLLEENRFKGGPPYYCLTDKGLRLSHASARQYKRASVERELSNVLTRVRQMEQDDRYLQRVSALVLFGSYLSSKEKLGDLDLAFQLEDKDLPREEKIARFRAAYRRCPVGSYIEQLYWSEREAQRQLRGRSGIVSITPLVGHIELLSKEPHKVLLPEGAELANISLEGGPRGWVEEALTWR